MSSLFVIVYRLTNSKIVLAFSYAPALTKMLVSSAKSTNSVLLCAFKVKLSTFLWGADADWPDLIRNRHTIEEIEIHTTI